MARFLPGAGWPESLEDGGESGAGPAPDVSRPPQLSAARAAAHARPARRRRLLDVHASPGRSPRAVVCLSLLSSCSFEGFVIGGDDV